MFLLLLINFNDYLLFLAFSGREAFAILVWDFLISV